MNAFAWLSVVAGLLCASGCSGLHSNQAPTQAYQLAPPLPAALDSAASVSATLRVVLPLAAPGLESDTIALTRSGQRFDFFAHSRWTAPLPELVQSATIEALRAGGRFRAVQSETVPLDSDYVLQLEIRRFQAEYRGDGPPTVRVQLIATLGRRADRSLISSVIAQSDVPASANRMQAVSAAFEAALGQVLEQLIRQVQPPAP